MDFTGEVRLGFVVRFWRGRGVAVVGVRDYDWPKDEPLTYGYG